MSKSALHSRLLVEANSEFMNTPCWAADVQYIYYEYGQDLDGASATCTVTDGVMSRVSHSL